MGEEKKEGEGKEGAEEHAEHERLLRSIGSWDFQPLDAVWPQRELFRPQSASCMPNGELLVGTPYETYVANRDTGSGFALEALPRSQFPAKTVAICNSASNDRSCLLASASSN